MNARWLNLWDSFRGSYWFLPTWMLTASLMLAVFMPMLDGWLKLEIADEVSWFVNNADSARSLLLAAATAMISLAGVVFSITTVTLSLTSSQFGSRLLRAFMNNRSTHFALGVFLATSVYCLLVSLRVDETSQAHPVPHLSLALGVVLTILSLGMLIYFIHNVAKAVQAPNVVKAVAEDLDSSINRMFPETLDEDTQTQQPLSPEERELLDQDEDQLPQVASQHEGYLLAIDKELLLELAVENNLVLRLLQRPGDFIHQGLPLLRVYGTDAVDKDLAEELNEAFVAGASRTPRQDVECAVMELVEVAVRALSPGINDPFTAINCIDRLGATLSRLAGRRIPSAWRHDSNGALRIVVRPFTFPEVLDAAFNQIRQFGRRSVAVMARQVEALVRIAYYVQRREDAEALIRQAQMIDRACRQAIEEVEDREDIQRRLDQLVQVLQEQQDYHGAEPLRRGTFTCDVDQRPEQDNAGRTSKEPLRESEST